MEAQETPPQHVETIPGIPTHWFDRRVALDVLRYHFSHGEVEIRIAVGFFSVRGYNLIRGSVKGKKLYILVGVTEPGQKRVEMAIINEIMADLRHGIDVDRYQAVRDLVEKMKRGDFRIVDARALPHHAKIYLVDTAVALVGSSNLSQQGLIESIEAGYTVTNPSQVRDYVRWYGEYFAQGTDLTERLIRELEDWLNLADPWDVYLKTLDALRFVDEPKLKRDSYRRPVGYQADVVARSLRHLDQHQGDMIVASTGLGKTVIGSAVALHLKEMGVIGNVLVIAPKAVAESWRRHLRPTMVNAEIFNPAALDAKSPQRNRHTRELMRILNEELDKQWLIIIDESHNFRNQTKRTFIDGQEVRVTRRAFERLIPAIKRSKAYVLELTATPLSTGIANVNDQLLLLPHTAPRSPELLPGIHRTGKHYADAWKIRKLADLSKMEVASVITTPHVARNYGRNDPESGGTFIDFNGTKKYVPDVMLYRVNAPLPFEDEVYSALKWGYFTTTSKNPIFRQTIENTVRRAWGSSPWALRDVISKSIGRPGWKKYGVKFEWEVKAYRQSQQYVLDLQEDRQRRREFLGDLVEKLEAMGFSDDNKLVLLADLVKRLHSEGKKVAIFSEFWATVAYLEAGLTRLCQSVQWVSLLERMVRPGSYKAKTETRASEALFGFAPIANEGQQEDSKFDVFLATDAYGVGVNMEDAQAVINYDLAWTPIEPTQRAGRILRFWHEPREVELYSFVPTPKNDLGIQAVKIARRWDNLIQRDKHIQVVTDFSTLTASQDPTRIIMAELAKTRMPPIEVIGQLDPLALDIEPEQNKEALSVSPIFQHTAQLEGQRDRVKELRDDLISALDYQGNKRLVYFLVRVRGRYQWGIFDINTDSLWPSQTDLTLLNLIACRADTPRAMVGVEEIEREAGKAIDAWCNNRSVDVNEVERVCTLYLNPQDDTSARYFMRGSDDSLT